jgi:hypothetical protein
MHNPNHKQQQHIPFCAGCKGSKINHSTQQINAFLVNQNLTACKRIRKNVIAKWLPVICCQLSEKGRKSQMSSMQSFVFDPLSWFLVPFSVICCLLSVVSCQKKQEISNEQYAVLDPCSLILVLASWFLVPFSVVCYLLSVVCCQKKGVNLK